MIKKKILFRVDAGAKIGLGHFYRSIHLATELKKRGHSITFTFESSDFWEEELKQSFPFQSIPLANREDEKTELAIIKSNQFDMLYVDSFINYEEDFINEIKSLGVKVVFYQNNTEAKKYADIFILPSIHQGVSFFSDFNPKALIYKGLKYFTFSKSILSLKRKSPANKLSSIAIIAGGSDPQNTLIRLYKMLSSSKMLNKINFTFFYGVNFMHKSEIENFSTDNCKWEQFNYSNILSNDLLVSAFGVSTYEFLALGMPIVSYGHQPQNADSANYLAEKTQSLVSIGNIDDITATKLEETLGSFLEKPLILKELVVKAKAIIDLKGVERVIEILER